MRRDRRGLDVEARRSFTGSSGKHLTTRGSVADLSCWADRNGFAGTDAPGAFRMDRVSLGKVGVRCVGDQSEGSATTTVERGATAYVELALKARTRAARGDLD
jgi:hypothetical protein